MLRLPLKGSFRYVHEPLRHDEQAMPLLGNAQLIDELNQRLRWSRGGTFLITGFRGVGKSTVVMRALAEIASARPDDELILPITLNVARPMTPDQLLFAVVRRTYEALHDRRVLPRLDQAARRALMLAHVRTSLGLKQTHADASERAATLNVGMGPAAGKLTGPAGWLTPSAGFSGKRTRSLALEASYLTYSDTDVEHDLARIIGLLARKTAYRRKWRLWSRGIPRVHLIIVLDEVDKLTSSPPGLDEIERLLGSLKNTLTMQGAHFLVVAGPDLHDHVVKDTSRGNSVYESVFAWRSYIPCSWGAADTLLESVLDDPRPGEVEQLARYLRFKARGIPRRLLQEFGELVRWEDERPFLVIDDQDEQRVAFYARLEELLELYFRESDQNRLFQVPIDEDRWRLTGYYIVDWILKKQGDSFTAMDVVGSADKPELDPLLRVARSSVDRLLRHLEKHGVLTVARDPGRPDATNYGSDPDAGLVSYKLADGVKRALLGIAWGNEGERAALDVSLRMPLPDQTYVQMPDGPVLPDPYPLPDNSPPPFESVLRTVGDRYELVELIGEGGQSTVYRARDAVFGRDVAVKVPRRFHFGNSDGVARLRREAAIAIRLDHPRIVHTYDVARDDEGWPILVMELVEGRTLNQVVSQLGPLDPVDVVRLGAQVAEALEYLEALQVNRIDLKPSNIMMTSSMDAVIVDFGIAKTTGAAEITSPEGGLVGTPAYMSPETLRSRAVDIRADIYSLGVILYFSLTGKSPYSGEHNIPAVLASIMAGRLDLSPLSDVPQLQEIIAKATAIDPNDRFQHPAELRAALVATPEGRSLGLPDTPGSVPHPPAEASGSHPSEVPAGDDAPRTPDPEWVYGVDCKNGHFNDPRVPYCAVCGIALVQRTLVPFKGPRPPLGVLVLDDGRTLLLDGAYLIGRDPERAPEVVAGEARPVKVTSPDGSISRRHLRVRLDAWDVNLIDLGSVNGTEIQPPGDPNFYELPLNEPVPILPGTTVRLGRSRLMLFQSDVETAVPHEPGTAPETVSSAGGQNGHVGPYELIRPLGEGGMGVVHLAKDPQHGRQVAIKVLRPEVAGDEIARSRLAREVEIMRRVRGRHVAELIDADVKARHPYIVTRYVPGTPLDQVVRRDRPLALGALLRVGKGVAEALAAMHAAGVIHRDLKPGNVLMTEGDPVVIDFGIAQLVDSTRITQTGMFIGAPGYLAPEIIEGNDAGPEVDIHAWAGTMLYAATGEPPFGKGTLEMIFFNITAGKANVRAAPVLLRPILRAAFSRQPSMRPTATQLVTQLSQLEEGLV
ncbi:protein kinase [Nonomuraea angiospora]|uniref:protein kinase domain-containing protein n=1 Tax=Nonomuraea angiospora TaxID=46172 RepID=UPI00379B79B2